MKKRCSGCGIELQDQDPKKDGYIPKLTQDICLRCFRMKNYGEYTSSTNHDETYLPWLKEIAKRKELVCYIVDVLNIQKDLTWIKTYLKENPIILIFTKRDALPLTWDENSFLEYYKNQNLGFQDYFLLSGKKDAQLDQLMESIRSYLVHDEVYFVGETNAGKSTLINRLIKNYTTFDPKITVSFLPSTTLDFNPIPFSNFTLFDTPGIVFPNRLFSYLSQPMMKKITPKQEIFPRIYQLQENTGVRIEDFLEIFCTHSSNQKNSFVFYVSNDLIMKKIYSFSSLPIKTSSQELVVDNESDLVIMGLGFIHIKEKTTVLINTYPHLEIFVRKHFKES